MELNGLAFSQTQLAELYKDKLVVTEPMSETTAAKPAVAAEPVMKAEPKPSINIKGKNKKGILWVVDEPGQAFLDDADFEFLSQILTACKMNMDDIALVNLAHNTHSIHEITDVLKPSVVLLCGIEYQSLPFKLDEYIIYPHTKKQYFLSDRLEDLRNDKAKKTKLWLALKAIFSL